MLILKQSTAVDVLIGPFVDGTDGATTEEALSPSVQLSKNGQAAATKNDVTTPVHDNAGYYNCELDATDTNTVGTLVAFVEGATGTHLQVKHEFQVVEEAVYDAIFGSGAALNVGSAASVTAGVTLAAGAVTNASLAGNMEIVFETDFATNYNTTRNGWATNAQDFIGTTAADPFNAQVVAASVTGDTKQTADVATLITTVGTAGDGLTNIGTIATVTNYTNDLSKYSGPRGPGVYLNGASANTNTTSYTDGIITNPVQTIGAAKTIADDLSLDRIYILNDTAITLAATMEDYEFVGIGAPIGNSIALASQDVDGSHFYNLTITGVQGGTTRVKYEDCIFGTATIHCHALRCGLTDAVTGITFSNNDDNLLDSCYSMVAGNSAPAMICSGANLDLAIRHYSGGVELKTLNATATVSIETDGQVIFAADCNTGASVTMRGNLTITDNTGGMSSLTTGAVYDKRADITSILADTNELQTDWADAGRLDVIQDAIKTKTDQMVYTKTNELDVNTKSINDATVVGDGNATPWDGA